MMKFALKLTKENEVKILGMYDNKDEALAAGGQINAELPKSAGTLSCIYADFDDKGNIKNNKYQLFHVWL